MFKLAFATMASIGILLTTIGDARADDRSSVPITFGPAPGTVPSYTAPPTLPRREPAPSEKDFAVDVGVGSAFPLYVGAQIMVETPLRLLFGFEGGVMPKAYAYAIDDVLKSLGAYDDATSELIRQALSSSMVLRPSVGWRPFPNSGFEMLVGYTLISLGGGAGASEVIEAATGKTLPTGTGEQVPLHSTLHNFHARLGWRFLLGEHWVLRASLDYLHCFASSSRIGATARTAAGQKVIDDINQTLNDNLNSYYTKYVNAPVAGLNLSYRF